MNERLPASRGRARALAVLLFFAAALPGASSAQGESCDHAGAQSSGVEVRQKDGRHFLFAKLGNMTRWSLLVQSNDALASPVVSGDGYRLAYLSREFGQWRAFLQRLATGYRLETAVFAHRPHRICFSGDGDSLIAVDEDGQVGVISIKSAWASLN
ncbi:MAG: hypothetical protein R3174_07765 [Gammaproteobacteria bacterium]|nr:hypothetical protein [Gammaproteobacteria bacterium]